MCQSAARPHNLRFKKSPFYTSISSPATSAHIQPSTEAAIKTSTNAWVGTQSPTWTRVHVRLCMFVVFAHHYGEHGKYDFTEMIYTIPTQPPCLEVWKSGAGCRTQPRVVSTVTDLFFHTAESAPHSGPLLYSGPQNSLLLLHRTQRPWDREQRV